MLFRSMKSASRDLCATLWPTEEPRSSIFALADKLTLGPAEVDEWRESAARSGAGLAMAMVLAHYPEVDVDEVAEGAPIDEDGNSVDVKALLPRVRRAASRVAEYVDLEERVEKAPEE